MEGKNNVKKVAVDYKSKHFVIQDEDMLGDFDGIDPYVDVDKVIEHHLFAHVSDCRYYGIPAYHGKDEELKKKIAEIDELLDKQEIL